MCEKYTMKEENFTLLETLCFRAPGNKKWLHTQKFEAAQYILETKATGLTVAGG